MPPRPRRAGRLLQQQITKIASARWRALPDEDKRPYVERYSNAMAGWKQNVAEERAAFEAGGRQADNGMTRYRDPL